MLNSSALSHIWHIVEQTQARIILELSDSELIRKIKEKLEATVFLSVSELNAAQNYIRSRIPLIRDLAEARLTSA